MMTSGIVGRLHSLVLGIITGCFFLAGCATPARAQPAENAPRLGKFIRLVPPLTKAKDRVQRTVNDTITAATQAGQRPVFVFEIEPGQVDLGEALNLARFISSPSLGGATTIAYIPQEITGHSVLIALACDEIVMAPTAALGKAGQLEPAIDPGLRNSYHEIASRRRTIPPALAMAMLDPESEVIQVETDLAREFVLAADLAELKKAKAIRSEKVVKRPGAAATFTAKELREWGFVSYLAADRRELAQVWKLGKETLYDDDAPDGAWRAARFELTGVITTDKVSQIQRLVGQQIRDRGIDFIFLAIDSPGGSIADSLALAHYLAQLDRERRTVAYITHEARGDAALAALACDQIIMAPGAILGGPGTAELSPEDRDLAAKSIEDLALRKLRSPALARALVDDRVSVFRYVRKSDGLTNFFSEAEFEKLSDAELWRREDEITKLAGPLQLDGAQALELDVASQLVDSLAEVRERYHLERDPVLAEPSWVTTLVNALNMPGVSMLLIIIGFAAIYVELHTPGVGLGGIIATVCFLLYFWSSFLGGTAGWLEVMLFITGLVLVMIEIFVLPGVTVFGLAGGMLVVASLILASQTFVVPHNEYQVRHLLTSLWVLVGAGVGTIAIAVLLNRFLPETPLFNRMMLAPPSGQELNELSRRESLAQWEYLVGQSGVTTTVLNPAGKARIGDELVDVITSGEYIDRNRPIVVAEARGSRVIVQEKS